MNRGARHQPVFLDDGCYEHFLGLLSELPERFGVVVHAYALLPNHFHLLLGCPRGGLSQAMQYLQSRYSKYLNQRPGWDGPVWRSRFRNRVVEVESTWQHLLAYVHLNPIEAGLCQRPGDWTWSSHGLYVGDGTSDFVELAELRGLYGSVEAYVDYLAEVQSGRRSPPVGFDPEDLWRHSHTEWLAVEIDTPKLFSVDEAWAVLERVSGLDREALCAAPRGRRGNPARWVTFWWLWSSTVLSQAEIGRSLGAKAPVVSTAIRRVRETRKSGDTAPEGLGWVRELDRVLLGR